MRASIVLIQKDKKILGISRGKDLLDMGLPGGKKEKMKLVYLEKRLPNKIVATFVPEKFSGKIISSHEGEVRWCFPEELIAETCSYRNYNIALFKFLNII